MAFFVKENEGRIGIIDSKEKAANRLMEKPVKPPFVND
jgi:hypothetical protein